MNRNVLSAVLVISLVATLFCGCTGKTSAAAETAETVSEVAIVLEGGSGKASVQSPARVTVHGSKTSVRIVFNSSNYDYVLVAGKKYLNEAAAGNSTFTVPVANLTDSFTLVADTTAMSIPHEITYTIRFPEAAGSPGEVTGSLEDAAGNQTDAVLLAAGLQETGAGPELAGVMANGLPLVKTGEVSMTHSSLLRIDQYGDYRLVSIAQSGRFLVVPEAQPVPEHLPEDVVVLQQPLDKTYLVSTSAMDLVAKIDAIDMLQFCGLKENDWYVPEARNAMKNGKLRYAGKYNMPDYELLFGSGCTLAIENTMVLHTPEAKEKLEELGIPVLIERSTYEKDPLGRLEWIKLYGTLFGREQQAAAFFDRQLEKVAPVMQLSATGKTVCFFYVTTSGAVNVRTSSDYIAQMIRLAGGTYVPAVSGEDGTASSTMNMQMESFYAATCDADILIYNGTIVGGVETVQALLAKDRLFADFTAVQTKQAYYIEKRLFQETSGLADFILDMNKVMNGQTEGLVYVKRMP